MADSDNKENRVRDARDKYKGKPQPAAEPLPDQYGDRGSYDEYDEKK